MLRRYTIEARLRRPVANLSSARKTVKVNRLLLSNTSVMGVGSAEFWSAAPEYAGQQWRELMLLMHSGGIDPPLGPVFALDDVAAAICELDERRAVGRVLIQMR